MIHILDSSAGSDRLGCRPLEIRTARTSADWEIARQMADEKRLLGGGASFGWPAAVRFAD